MWCVSLRMVRRGDAHRVMQAIDPRRWIMFEGAREDKLSGFAVQTLFDKDGAITVVGTSLFLDFFLSSRF